MMMTRTVLLVLAFAGLSLAWRWQKKDFGRRGDWFDRSNSFKGYRGSQTSVTEFKKVVTTYDDYDDDRAGREFKGWLGRQPPEFRKQFDGYKREVEQDFRRERERHSAGISRCSSAAKNADQQLLDICNDSKLSANQKYDRIDSFQRGLPKNVQAELDGLGDDLYITIVQKTFILKV